MNTSSNDIRIIIADDHPIVRRGLKMTIEAEPHLKVVAEADDGEAALAAIEQLQPAIAILDVNMPRLSGFEVMRIIREKNLPVAVIFLTIHGDEVMFNEALDLGARGYVLKESAVTDIVTGIKTVAAGKPYITASLTAHLLNRNTRAAALTQNKPGLNSLTATERRILRLVAANKQTKEIAGELGISYRTVENHRTNICQKLGLRGHNVLLRFALEHRSELL